MAGGGPNNSSSNCLSCALACASKPRLQEAPGVVIIAAALQGWCLNDVGQRFLGSVSVRAEISIFFRRVLCGASNPCAQAHKHQSGPLRPAPPWTAAGGAHPRPPGWPERPGPARSHYPISNSKRERNMGSMAPTPCPLGGGSGTRPGAGDSVRPGSWQRNIPWPEQPGPRLSQ